MPMVALVIHTMSLPSSDCDGTAGHHCRSAFARSWASRAQIIYRFVGPKEELRAGVAQRVSSVRRSKWSGYWGPADLVGALQPLPQMTHFCPHPHAPIAAQHWTGQRVR
jgi:hypothetical protein